jgi:pimeloyl-CoA synthetase
MAVFADLWRRYGCPQRMKIHISKIGEEITLINGLPVTDNAKKVFYS